MKPCWTRRDIAERRRSFSGLIGLLVLLACLSCGPARAEGLPRSWVLWAWDRPEDLRFLKGRRDVAVAYFAADIELHEQHIVARRRGAHLRLAQDTPRFPLVHVRNARGRRPKGGPDQVAQLAEAIVSARRDADHLQIDWEAPATVRGFYAEVIAAVRRRLPAGAKLSATALVSWCQGDRWLDGLPVDEVVPMFFRMGPNGELYWRRHIDPKSGARPPCDGPFGLALDEPRRPPPRAGQIYLFNPRPWREGDLSDFIQRLP